MTGGLAYLKLDFSVNQGVEDLVFTTTREAGSVNLSSISYYYQYYLALEGRR